ncbi:MAG: GGDEF domain-containing protein [Candidatus Manganitrophus sp.]|nr:MAG: GGDEF domain-containing protein [Candidatus Manganitrophus sp.]
MTELVGELEARKREMSLLSEMGELLQTCRTLQEADGVISQFLRQLFPAESGALYILMPSRNMVERNSVWGDFPPPVRVFPPDECWALRRGQIHRAEGKAGIVCRHAAPSSSAATLCIPMQAQSDMLGVLHLILAQLPSSEGLHETEEGQLKAAKQKLAVTVTEQVALALSNIRLRETLRNQAIRDPLTGLFNRRYLEETLEQEISRAERNEQQIGVIMIDIDHFKRYNDTYGHEAGDAVLSELGRFLEKFLRGGDPPPLRGEEFTVLLPGASLENALLKAERLREGVKELNVQHRGRSVGAITLSMGVACFPDQGLTGEILLRAADQALYQAKAAGRDRVMSAGAVSDVENCGKKKEGSPSA